jgi:hypothetical protein
MTKTYNPHMVNVVRNHRAEADKRSIAHSHLTDEQLFALIVLTSGLSTPEEDMEYFLEELQVGGAN